MKLTVEDPTGRQKELTGMAQVAGGYPLKDGPLPDWTWRSLVEDLRLPYLPAGPWGTAPLILGEALCLHNTLVEAERWMSRHDPRPRQPS